MVLRDLIRPYLLRRTKADVQLALDRSEQVLFCQLSEEREPRTSTTFAATWWPAFFLAGPTLSALTALLKVCNHPHLLTWEEEHRDAGGVQYGEAALWEDVRPAPGGMWHANRDRALIFQTARYLIS